MEIKTIARKWGNSIAIILPKTVVDENKISEDEEITIEIKKRPTTGDFFGKFPRKSKKTAQQIKDELRRGWD